MKDTVTIPNGEVDKEEVFQHFDKPLIQKLKEIFSDIQKEGLDRETSEIVQQLKDTGLMAPEICFIAFNILEEYSSKAEREIQMFHIDLPNTLREAEELLKKLQNGKENS